MSSPSDRSSGPETRQIVSPRAEAECNGRSRLSRMSCRRWSQARFRTTHCLVKWAGLWGIVLLLSGCASSLYGWQSRTNSTPVGSSFHADLLKDRAVALFPAVTSPGLRGNEAAIPFYLWDVVRKLAPTWKTITARETVSRINGQGLADDYIKLMLDYEPTSILNRDLLRKIAGALGVRYVFQPRLIFFVQTMTDRWKVPAFDVRIAQTRSSIMRLSLQLWDVENGELVWVSVAETNMANEAVSQDPVYLEDIARATLGSMMADLMTGKTASRYTPLNELVNNLIQEAMPKEKSGQDVQSQTTHE